VPGAALGCDGGSEGGDLVDVLGAGQLLVVGTLLRKNDGQVGRSRPWG